MIGLYVWAIASKILYLFVPWRIYQNLEHPILYLTAYLLPELKKNIVISQYNEHHFGRFQNIHSILMLSNLISIVLCKTFINL
jgi:hypothetical protein